MQDLVLQLGVGGILVVIVLRLVFDFMKDRNIGTNGNGINDKIIHTIKNNTHDILDSTTHIEAKVDDVHQWTAESRRILDPAEILHDNLDRRVFMERVSKAVESLAENDRKQTAILENLVALVEATNRVIRETNDIAKETQERIKKTIGS